MDSAFWLELEEVLEGDFTGQIVLHCDEGRVKNYEVRQKRTPRTGDVDLTESLDKRRNGP